MSEKELQAHDMVRRRSWSRAVALYDQILATNPVNNGGGSGSTPPRALKDQQIACLLGRCECLLEMGKYEGCLADARKVLALLADQVDCLASVSRARRWLVHALCKLHKYTEAEHTLREWINELSGQQIFSDISKTLERYKSILQLMSGHHKATQKISHVRLEDEMSILDTKLDHWATNNLPLDKYSKLLSNKGLKKREQQHNGTGSIASSTTSGSSFSSSSSSGSSITGAPTSSAALQKTNELLAAIKLTGGKHTTDDQENVTTCSYCTISFQTRNELRQHCQTESHQNVIMSDEGRDWKWRPPPRGFTLDSYSLCEAYSEAQTCHYGNQCVEAHGLDELNEWKDRFEYRRMRVQKACEKELYGKSYTEQILDRWIQATAPERVMCEKIDGIEAKCEQELVTSISSKSSKREWVFEVETTRPLKAVALLQDAHRNHFAIKTIKLASSPNESVELKSDQEWVAHGKTTKSPIEDTTATTTDEATTTTSDEPQKLQNEITIEFNTEIYGTFRQAICFDVGTEPLLVKHICVDVVPVGDVEKIEEIKRDIINNSATRWDVANTSLVKFETTIGTHLKTEAYMNDLKHEKELLERYPCPRAPTFTLTQSTIVEKRLTQNNYRSRTHELLYVEEIARYEHIARFNVRTKLTVASNYILTPAGMATSTAKYSLSGELFALMRLGKDISEDTSPGRLILSNCSSVYISAPEDVSNPKDKKRSVYEALIEDKGKNVIYLKLSAKCVEAMSLKADTEIDVDIQFQLNRLSYCEWHNAVDKITDFKIIFPATDVEPNIPWTPKKQWSESCEPKLNAKQREAVNAITTSLSIKLPPILLIGPFGTGKTYTLAQAIKQLLLQPESKILICTHSNSAADLYIKEYLHPWIEEGLEEATPLRVYYHKRWVATVNSVVQKYCITDGAGNFRRPTVEDIMKHRIVVVTLSISMELSSLGLPKGYFTHIFLDEAAQAMECEAIMPLALANDTTRIVLAGDHMQMSPELFSAFAKERRLHISLLERLYDHYPSNFPCKILLCENYRAHEAIIKFTSELFYEQKLIASGKQPRHDRFYPLTFFTTRGEDVQDKNSTAFYNNAEVYEVVERVSELRKRWPPAWGKINDASIGIMTPYADQVFRIRSELRKRRMGGISVERVLNVQGKQFRAVFLSTVRTRRTCMPQLTNGPNGQTLVPAGEVADYGFLSNSKLLNTAITRAQSLVAVVGDPVALCSIGRCRKVWERFIEICDEHKSLFGITWSNLRSQLDGVELKRGYVLNPLAPEFIPRSLQPEAYLREQAAMYLNSHHGGPHPGQPPHNVGAMQGHPGMLGGPGGGGASGQMQMNHMAAAMAASQQLSHMFGQHSMPYNAAAAAAMMAATKGNGPHHFPGGGGHMNHMHGMRGPPPGPAGGPPQQSGAPPPHLRGMPPQMLQQNTVANAAGPYAQYMQHWQQPLRPPNPGAPGGGYQPGQGPPNGQNPNASLWGPPPQSNPWSVLPNKQQQMALSNQQQTNPGNGGRMQPPTTANGQQAPSAVIRGGSVPLQPPPPPPNNMQRNPSELGYLAKKTLYQQQHPPVPPPAQAPPHVNAYAAAAAAGAYQQNQLPPMLNQRGGSVGAGSIPNGPISPMEPPYMQRAPNGPQAPPQHNFFGVGKEKDYQFLNMQQNMGVGNMYAQQPQMQPNNISGGVGNKQQSPSAMSMRFPQPNDYGHLLPPNMTIFDMSFEAKEAQYSWYRKLLETHGQEAANKFADVLRQVMTTLHPMPQPTLHNKPPTPMQQQMMPRELMPPLPPQAHTMSQQNTPGPQPPLVGSAAQQRYMHPGAGMPNSMSHNMPPMSSVEPPPLDGSINFNQQVDLVFNSIMNGNDIAQPILRDVLGMVCGGLGGNVATTGPLTNGGGAGGGMLNGDMPLGGAMTAPNTNHQSRLFNMMGTNGVGQQQMPPHGVAKQQPAPPPAHMYANHMPQQQQPPQQPQQQHHQPAQQQPLTGPTGSGGGFMGNTPLLGQKDLLFGGGDNSTTNSSTSLGSGSSVPLYRRQPMTGMGNGGITGNGAGGYNNSNATAGNAGSGFNMLSGGGSSNIILPGLDTGNNLIEALFQANNSGAEQTNKDNLLYNNFNAMKSANDMELFHSGGGGGAAGDSLHHHPNAANNHAHYHNNVPTSNDNRGATTTYAAVLSQGPQAQHQPAHAHQAPTTQQTQADVPDMADKDPFAAIRELGQGTNGFYNYFQ